MKKVLKDVGLNLYIAKLLLEKKQGQNIGLKMKNKTVTFTLKLVSHDRRKDKRI